MNGNKLCELHQQKHEDCSCMIPYRLHTMPSKESIRLRWANALNRKSLPKQVFVCSEFFLDGNRQKEPQFHNLRLSHIRETIDWQPDYAHTDKNILHGRKGCSSYDWNRYDVGKRQYSDRLRLFVVYRGNERGIFNFGWTNENRKYIFFPTRCRRSVASCVNETKTKFTV